MKLVVFEERGGGAGPDIGALIERGIVSLGPLLDGLTSAQAGLQTLIESFDSLRPGIERLQGSAAALPLDQARLLPPVPRPGKILASTSVCRQERNSTPEPLLMTLKTAGSIIGPDENIELPDTYEPWQFSPEVELAAVIKGPAKRVPAAGWREAVFGFTCAIDVAARGGSNAFGRDLWVAKSDTLCPIGPCIVTADEIADPAALRLRSRLNGRLFQDFSYATADYDIGQQMAFITTVMTLHSGDLVLLGSAEQDAGELHDGDHAAAEIEGIGGLTAGVRSPAQSRPSKERRA